MNWSKYQLALYQAVAETQDSLLVKAVAGSGKCLARGTPVLLYDGTILPVEQIKAGMRLMGPDSQPRQVLTVSQGKGLLYRINPEKGESWVCNAAHVLTLTGTNRFKGQTIDISVTEYLALCARRPSFESSWKLWRTGVDFHKTPRLSVKPYLAGLWLGDGNTAGAAFSNNDIEVVRYLVKVARHYGAEAIIREDKTCLNIRLRMGVRGKAGRNTPHKLQRLLLKHFRNGRGNKTIPPAYLTARREARLELLAGLLDTDGSYSNGTYDFVTKWRSLADQVLFLCRSLGFAAYLTPKAVNAEVYWRICISGELSSIPCKIERKKARPRRQIKRVTVTGFTLEALGEDDYFGFTLDGDGRFLLGDFTVTHNTTSLVEAIRHVPQDRSVLFCAFNKAIAETLRGRITQPNATCATLHSLGLRAWQSFCGGGVKVEGRKSWDLLKQIEPRWDRRKELGGVVKLVGLAKQYGIVPRGLLKLAGTFQCGGGAAMSQQSLLGPLAARRGASLALDQLPDEPVEVLDGAWLKGLMSDEPESWQELMDTYDIDSEEVDLSLAREMLKQSLLQARSVVDYDDMLWLPVVTQAPFNQYDVVFVDEVQDLNGIQIEMVARMLSPTGRVICVGDEKQSIYRFRGAHAEAMAELAERFHCRPLPLSISYRCPKAVVRKAQSWVPVIEPAPDAAEGLVVEEPGEWALGQFRPADVVLCRLTRPLVALAFKLIRARIPCRVLGRDIGQGLIRLLDKSKIADHQTVWLLVDWLKDYEHRETQQLKQKQEWGKIGLLQDRVETLRLFTDDAKDVGSVRREIESLFKDNGSGSGITLSTIHKAKGMEWDRVFILDAQEFMPPAWATDLESERNLCYVAATRAKQELYYIGSRMLR